MAKNGKDAPCCVQLQRLLDVVGEMFEQDINLLIIKFFRPLFVTESRFFAG